MKRFSPLRLAMRYAAIAIAAAALLAVPMRAVALTNPQSGAVGLEGTVNVPPPKTGAVISVPSSGQSFGSLPVTVSGICPKGLLVKLFKNGVFAGSAECQSGSFAIKIDLFNGKNDLIARVYDSLDQAGPDSNKVSVTFSDANYATLGPRVTITSAYAKRGATPGQTLTWPISLSGGTGPYALSVDWGDSKDSDLISQQYPGDVLLKHVYDSPGVYNIIVKATDKNGVSAFLQLVGIGNGALGQDTQQTAPTASTTTTVVQFAWWPILVLFPLIFIAFWLGSRHRLDAIRKKLDQGQSLDE